MLAALLIGLPVIVTLVFVMPAPIVQSAHVNPAVVATITVGTGPNFIVVDTGANRLYVSNRGGNTVSVIDTTTDTLIATIVVGDGPDDLRLQSAINRLYVTNIVSGTVSIIDTITNTVKTNVTVGANPQILRYSGALNRVYALNRDSGTVTIIDGSKCGYNRLGIKFKSEIIKTISSVGRTITFILSVGHGCCLIFNAATKRSYTGQLDG